jgi:hypothetical protein
VLFEEGRRAIYAWRIGPLCVPADHKVVVVPGNIIFRWVSRSDQDDPLRREAIVLATAGATSDRSLQQNRHSPQPRIFATILV